jgi:hypothetical protein
MTRLYSSLQVASLELIYNLGFLALGGSLILLPLSDRYLGFVHLLDFGKCSTGRFWEVACVQCEDYQHTSTEDEVCFGSEAIYIVSIGSEDVIVVRGVTHPAAPGPTVTR